MTETRQRLSRALVVQTALALIDEEGLSALTMRRVGQRLGVEAMSLYGYVANREALLDAVVDSIVDELLLDPDVQLAPQDGWRDYLTRLAHGVRRFALTHPRAFPLVATRPPEAPFIRPPLRSMRWLDAFLAALSDKGFTDEAVLYAYRAFTSFLLGQLLLEAGARTAEEPAVARLPGEPVTVVAGAALQISPSDAPTTPAGAARNSDASRYPAVARFAERLAEDHSRQEFEDGLVDLLDRLAAQPGSGPA